MTNEKQTLEPATRTPEHGTRLSRRLVLAGLGTAGLAVGTGAATVAGLLDTELTKAGITGGSVQLKADYRVTRNGETVETVPEDIPDDADCTTRGLLDGDVLPTFTLEDVVPTETGSIDACLYVCENPSYLWVSACAVDDEEVTHTDREVAAGDDTATDGELAEVLEVTLYLDEDGDGERGGDDTVLYDGTLAGLDTLACDGLQLTRAAAGAGEAASGVELTGCTALGKIEEPSGEDFTVIEPGDELRSTTSIFTDGSVVGGDVYEFTTGDGDGVRVELSDPQFNDDGELVEATLTMLTSGVGFCQSATKSAGRPDTVPVVEEQGCPTTITVSSPRPTPETPIADKQQISHVTLWVCPHGGGGGGTQSGPVCYEPGRHCVGLDWELPVDTGVEATTDSVTVEIAFEAVQCRHNMANTNPFAPAPAAADGGPGGRR